MLPKGRTNLLGGLLLPTGEQVLLTKERWQLITTVKHPSMRGRLEAVMLTIEKAKR